MATDERHDLSTVKRALLEIRELKARLAREEDARHEPIAIVGLACRFPGAPDADAFWSLLAEGRDGIGDVPPDRWDVDRYYDPDPDAPGRMYTKRGGFLRDVDRFDERFFGVTPREAATMDPQQRLLLEVSWEALEHAGEAADRLMGARVGVFVGLGATDHLVSRIKHLDPAAIDAYVATGGSAAVAAGRLAYTFGFQGPGVTIDTACSASLVAVHQACQSLRAGECRMALAGGASLMLLPEITINFCRARMLAPDGRCKTFDAAADGYVRSEGCGMVVLKRLSDARAASDRVLAVLRGSAVNQDGRSSGLTVPNGPAQQAVIRDALAQARVAAGEVDYVEAHGTGTSLGDPIEVNALGAVFGPGRPADRPLAIGSVKTNVGHLEAAAGMAGLIKVVLAMQHGELPPHLNLTTPNPHVQWRDLPIEVPTSRRAWPARDGRRVAGVSSFGFSGTNAHVVVEAGAAVTGPVAAVRDVPVAATDRPVHVLPISARTATALATVAGRLSAHMAAHPGQAFADVCHTAGTGRVHFAHRAAVVAADAAEARPVLDAIAAGTPAAAVTGALTTTAAPPVAFLFTGQGAQYVGMGRSLYETEPVFAATLDRCDAILRPHRGGRSVLDVMFDRDGTGAELDETLWAQPALFALEVALVELWRAWGIEPSIVMGHSLGEDVAACVAGVWSLEDALPLIASRGRLMQALPKLGEMHVVFAGEADVRASIAPEAGAVTVAALNTPDHVTISGRSDAMARVLGRFAADGVKTKPVVASHAFHSPLMDPMLDEYEAAVAAIPSHAPRVTLYSNVTGAEAGDEVRQAAYWRRHVRETVRFADAIRAVWARGCRLFVEIGPSPVLLGMAQRSVPDGEGDWLPSLRRSADDWRDLATSVATLHARGAPVDWAGFDGAHPRSRVTLPTYPFERSRFPLAAGADGPGAASPAAVPTGASVASPDATAGTRWTSARAAARRQAGEGPLDLAVGSYAARWRSLDDIALEIMAEATVGLGAFTDAGERHTAGDVCARAGVTDTHGGLVRRWLETLAVAGRLRRDGDAFVSDAPLVARDAAARIAAARATFADDPAVFDYLDRCRGLIPEVVTGRESPLETLFPGGDSSLADALYRDAPVARYFNAIVRAAVEAAAAWATPDRPLRVLEIGAGTGGTSAGVLAALPADRVRYAFTDVGPLFLAQARERLAAYPFVTYHTLDIERHPREQGFAPHAWDVIVAANVLHATRNLHETIDHVAWLLASSGVLVLYEATSHPSWFDVTTGLIGGWQRFDDDLRTDVPLVAPEVWARVLRGHGFVEAEGVPAPGTPAEVLGRHVIVARGTPVASAVPAGAVEPAVGPPPTVAPAASGQGRAAAGDTGVRERLAALPAGERRDALADVVRDQLMAVLRIDASRPIGRTERLMDLGVDSLMAVEFRNRLSRTLDLPKKLPATLIFDAPTIDAMADFVLDRVFVPADVEAGPADPPGSDRVTAERERAAAKLEAMTEAEVEALLNERLGDL